MESNDIGLMASMMNGLTGLKTKARKQIARVFSHITQSRTLVRYSDRLYLRTPSGALIRATAKRLDDKTLDEAEENLRDMRGLVAQYQLKGGR